MGKGHGGSANSYSLAASMLRNQCTTFAARGVARNTSKTAGVGSNADQALCAQKASRNKNRHVALERWAKGTEGVLTLAASILKIGCSAWGHAARCDGSFRSGGPVPASVRTQVPHRLERGAHDTPRAPRMLHSILSMLAVMSRRCHPFHAFANCTSM